MASLVLGAVGAAVGSLVGQPALGWQIGSMVGNMLFPPDGQDISAGMRLTDLKIQSSTYGAAIPLVWGRVRLAGNLIWATDIVETRHEEEYGKGGGSVEVVWYTYHANCAVSVCEASNATVLRIWADSQLVYDVNSGNTPRGITIYSGSESQLPDPTIESFMGAGNVPAYRGQCLVVFSGFQLERFGNRIPNFTFEVMQNALASPRVFRMSSVSYVNTDWWNFRTPMVAPADKDNVWMASRRGGLYNYFGSDGWDDLHYEGLVSFDPNTGLTNTRMLEFDWYDSDAVPFDGVKDRPYYDKYSNLVWTKTGQYQAKNTVYGIDSTSKEVVSKTYTNIGWVYYSAVIDPFRRVAYVPAEGVYNHAKYLSGLGAVGDPISLFNDEGYQAKYPVIFSRAFPSTYFVLDSRLPTEIADSGLYLRERPIPDGTNINVSTIPSVSNTFIKQFYWLWANLDFVHYGLSVSRNTLYVVLNGGYTGINVDRHNHLFGINLDTKTLVVDVDMRTLTSGSSGAYYSPIFYDEHRDLLWYLMVPPTSNEVVAIAINPDTTEQERYIVLDNDVPYYPDEVVMQFTSNDVNIFWQEEGVSWGSVAITKIALTSAEANYDFLKSTIIDVSKRCGLLESEIDVSLVQEPAAITQHVTETFEYAATSFIYKGSWRVESGSAYSGSKYLRCADLDPYTSQASVVSILIESDGETPTTFMYNYYGWLRIAFVVDGDYGAGTYINAEHLDDSRITNWSDNWQEFSQVLPVGEHRLELWAYSDPDSWYAWGLEYPNPVPLVAIDNLTHYDSSGRVIEGLVIGAVPRGREILETLQKAAIFDSIESDNVIKFVPRGRAPVVNLTDDDLVI